MSPYTYMQRKHFGIYDNAERRMDFTNIKFSKTADLDDELSVWTGILIILVQAGYSCMEAGQMETKHKANTFFKTFLHLLVSNLAFWFSGYGIAFNSGNSILGLNWWTNNQTVPSDFLYKWAISSLPVTILSATVADRISLTAFLINSVLITGVLQPMTIHWIWTSEGWLQKLGCSDPAGTCVTFVFAGASSFAASLIISLRDVDKFFIRSFQTYGLGSLITIVGLLTLNYNTLCRLARNHQYTQTNFGEEMENTILGSAGGCIISMLISKLVDTNYNQQSKIFSVTVNGSIAGIVAVYGSTESYSSLESYIIGTVGAIIFLQFHYLFVWLKVNDPSDGFPIYFGSGLWGITAANVFTKDGILFNHDTYNCLRKLFINLIGTLIISTWAAGWTTLIFLTLKVLKLLQKNEGCQLKEFPDHATGLFSKGTVYLHWMNHSSKSENLGVLLSKRRYCFYSIMVVVEQTDGIRHEECYVEVLPYGTKSKSDNEENGQVSSHLQVNNTDVDINLYENLNSQKEQRL